MGEERSARCDEGAIVAEESEIWKQTATAVRAVVRRVRVLVARGAIHRVLGEAGWWKLAVLRDRE